jgi:DNA-binding IclR family transcriptional regulator
MRDRRRKANIQYAAPALEKGLDILELLALSSEPLTHSEIARSLGRTINEVFRMLVCLEQRAYIARSGAGDSYQLTLKLFEMVHQHNPVHRLVTDARPLLRHVANETGQSCHLAMLNNGEVVVVAQFDAPVITGFGVRLGANVDLLNTGSGHVILAFQNEYTQHRILTAWCQRTKKKIPHDLSSHLKQIRRRGYEELASYQVHGVVNISYPVLNQLGEAIAAMTVPFLARIGDNVGPPEVKEALVAASEALSRAIGGKKLELVSATVNA